SPFYMSPEQMKSSRDVDLRTDIWALGIILFELLTQKVPFYGEALPQLCMQIMLEEPPSVRSFRPDIPAGLAAAVHKCLEKTPARRFQSVAELAEALQEFGSPQARESAAHISGIVPSVALELVQASALQRNKWRPSITAAIATMALALIAPVAVWAGRLWSPRSVVSSAVMSAPPPQASMALVATSLSQTAESRESDRPSSAAPNAAPSAPPAATGRPGRPQLRPASPKTNPDVPQPIGRPRILLDRSDPWVN
ncbi:MAG TPA: protein kinase, partial [Polyangiaceae bacterium]|nr:protein kinase [Polyangiaceae bacterium]